MIPERRAAISLNNAGVSLFEKGCYTQGVRTFSDAVGVLHKAKQVQQGKLTESASADLVAAEIEAKLYEAVERLTNPEPEEERDDGSGSAVGDVQVILSDFQKLSKARHILASSKTTKAIFVRLEACDYQSLSVEHNSAVQSSLILQNFGQAYRCMIGVIQDPSTQKDLQDGALQIFQTSAFLLAEVCEAHHHHQTSSQQQDEITRWDPIVLATTLAMHNLMQVSKEFFDGTSRHWQLCSKQLDFLRKYASVH